jgi:periplasmic divalent cation tolerance protein
MSWEDAMDEYIQVLTTTATRKDAQAIADALVENHLAGCVQIVGPIVSTFRWQGAIERTDEWLCLIKTEKRLYPILEQFIKTQHTYDTPEIIAIPIVAGSQSYLQWLSRELHPA